MGASVTHAREDWEYRKKEKIFDALDWLTAMTSHVPNKGEQMLRYYGHYSNACPVAFGKRKTSMT
jgi:hypothetical protein